jgi:hypothetical protein
MKFKAHRMLEATCPHCGSLFDTATGMTRNHSLKPGDVTICIECASWMVFTDELGLRPFTAQEIAALDFETHKLLTAATAAIKGLSR